MSGARSEPDDRDARQFERLAFFSDAVFAIAITVLVLDVKAPPGPHGELRLTLALPSILAFAISFFVIGRYWIAHHGLFGGLQREDGRLRSVNLIYLASIVFLPFPTSILELYPASATNMIFYAASVATVGLLQVWLCFVARRPALLRPGETRGITVSFVIHGLGAPLVFLTSIPVAMVWPKLAPLFWILIWPASGLAATLGGRLQKRIDGPAAAVAST
jgi:uncharacterized membrane protein